MKTTIFLLFPLLFLFSEPGFAQADIMDKYIYDSTLMKNQIFEKVFPEIDIYLQRLDDTFHGTKRIIGNYKGRRYYLPSQLNKLFKEVEGVSDAQIDDKVEAAILIMLLIQPDNDDISFSITDIVKRDTLIPNDKLYNYSIKYDYSGSSFDLFLKVEGTQLQHILIHYLGRFYFRMSFDLVYNTKSSKSIECEIQNINPETIDGKEHYYIVVKENNNLIPNLQVEFHIYGFESNQNNTYLKVKPVYGFDDSYFFEDLLNVDVNGNASSVWDLSGTIANHPNYTGICNMEILDGNGQTTTIDGKWLIPEKLKTGTFDQGYDYSVYYCDQFFIGHSNGINHASFFLDYIKISLEECWQKQVNEWNMCIGVENPSGTQIDIPWDNDSNYDIFINHGMGINL